MRVQLASGYQGHAWEMLRWNSVEEKLRAESYVQRLPTQQAWGVDSPAVVRPSGRPLSEA